MFLCSGGCKVHTLGSNGLAMLFFYATKCIRSDAYQAAFYRGATMSQGNQPTILLIEPDISLRRLVALGLQLRGVQVIEARKLAEVSAFDVQRLDMLVLDIDSSARRDWSQLEAVYSHPVASSLPVIILAWE